MQEENVHAKKFWIRIIEWYCYSNIHIAVCAFLFTRYSFMQFGYNASNLYSLLIATCTFIIYTLHKIIGLRSLSATETISEKFVLVANYPLAFLILCAATAIISSYLFVIQSGITQFLLFVPCFLTILYIFPIFKGRRRLRDLPYAKVFILALCWSLLCRWIPLTIVNVPLMVKVISSMSAFLFIAALGLVFDHKDATADLKNEVKTLVHIIPKYALLWIVEIILFCCFLLDLISIRMAGIDKNIFIALALYWTIGLAIFFTKYFKQELYYTFVLDGSMMLFVLTLFL